MEVVKGLQKIGPPNRVQQFVGSVSAIEVLNFDSPSAELAGRIYGDLESTGQTIGRADPMIASIALHHGLTLITGNKAHYQRIQALGYPLQIENWRT
jgi:tRNA(fMet)-specific endonuclease VapC